MLLCVVILADMMQFVSIKRKIINGLNGLK
jgi:hypothetical protein